MKVRLRAEMTERTITYTVMYPLLDQEMMPYFLDRGDIFEMHYPNLLTNYPIGKSFAWAYSEIQKYIDTAIQGGSRPI